jgi:ribonuclease E
MTLANYAALDGKYYHKTCYNHLFKLKGNYAEGFGAEQHKSKWAPVVVTTAPSVAGPGTSGAPAASTSSPSSPRKPVGGMKVLPVPEPEPVAVKEEDKPAEVAEVKSEEPKAEAEATKEEAPKEEVKEEVKEEPKVDEVKAEVKEEIVEADAETKEKLSELAKEATGIAAEPEPAKVETMKEEPVKEEPAKEEPAQEETPAAVAEEPKKVEEEAKPETASAKKNKKKKKGGKASESSAGSAAELEEVEAPKAEEPAAVVEEPKVETKAAEAPAEAPKAAPAPVVPLTPVELPKSKSSGSLVDEVLSPAISIPSPDAITPVTVDAVMNEAAAKLRAAVGDVSEKAEAVAADGEDWDTVGDKVEAITLSTPTLEK